MMSLLVVFKRQLWRETKLSLRQTRLILNSCLFFLMIMVFFPLTMPPEQTLLRLIAPGLIWIATLLAMFLSAERLFQQDYDDGVIEQWLVSGYPITLYIGPKILVHWASNLLPILVFCPLLGLMFNFSSHEVIVLMLSLIAGTPTMLALCALAATFSTGLKQKGVLMALVLLPLTVPIMIFGSATLTAALHGIAVQGYLALLLALSLLAAFFLPFAIAGVVRINLVE
jgi:heme exporter protein B